MKGPRTKPIIKVSKTGKITRADIRKSPTVPEKVAFVGRKTDATLKSIVRRMPKA